MSKQDKIPLFLYDWRRALVVFPAMFLYCGFLPILKLCGIVSINWFLAFAPIWVPLAGFWLIVGMVSYAVLVTEFSIALMPDKDVFEHLKNKKHTANTIKRKRN